MHPLSPSATTTDDYTGKSTLDIITVWLANNFDFLVLLQISFVVFVESHK